MKKYSRVRAVVDMDAIRFNVESMHRNIPEGTDMIVVIKTDGYGHGAVPIAKMFETVDYVWGFAVATVDEAMVLRKAGIQKPLLCLGCIFPEQFEEMVAGEIRMTVYDRELAKEASRTAVKMGKAAYFHIKSDTGMSRLGFPVTEESADTVAEIARLPGVKLEGMFTHFARADETDKTSARKQLSDFLRMKEMLKERGVTVPYYHCANSAGIIDLPEEAGMNLARAGISTYGMYPSDEVNKKAVPLKPAMELVSHVTVVKWIQPGTPVSYGGTFVAREPVKLATIPVGYGDGYPRTLSGKGEVLIHGQRAPIRGRVCMDQFMVDVTHIPDVSFGDEAVLVGKRGEEEITVEELAGISGRFHYEFVCDINKRVPREYLVNKEVAGQTDCFG